MDRPARPEQSPEREDFARSFLTGNIPPLRYRRRLLSRLPSDPRCKLCANPFGGTAGALMRRVGRGPWPKNPKFCGACFTQISRERIGAEIECSLLFADVRGSTTLAEAMRPSEFRALMNRFFETAARILVRHDAVVDKFVGDEVMAIFIPVMTGPRLHAKRAVDAAEALLSETSSWIPVGAGVNTGVAYVGVVGAEEQTDISAMGDPVNVAARLASMAGPAEALVTAAAARAAGLDAADLERRELKLRGRHQTTQVLVLQPSS